MDATSQNSLGLEDWKLSWLSLIFLWLAFSMVCLQFTFTLVCLWLAFALLYFNTIHVQLARLAASAAYRIYMYYKNYLYFLVLKIGRLNLHTSCLAHQAGTYPGFCSTKELALFLLPSPPRMGCQSITVTRNNKFADIHLYTWVERGTVGVKCFAQEHNAVSGLWPGLKPRQLHLDMSTLTMKPLCLKHVIRPITAHFPTLGAHNTLIEQDNGSC